MHDGSDDGRSTRWDAHRARRREQVVDAALAVLDEAGPDFGLDRVAARAGVTKPVIYRHFDDRAALVRAMGERAAHRLAERLRPAVHADGTPLRERIRAWVGTLVGFFDESPNVYLLLCGPVAPGGTDVLRDVTETLSGVLGEQLRGIGSDDPDAADVWAHGLVGFVQNTVRWWPARRRPERDRLVALLTAFVWAQIDGVAALQRSVTVGHGACDPD